MTSSATPDLLAAIVAASRRITAVRRGEVDEDAVERAARARTPGGASFIEALRTGPSPRVIAECKRRSPSRGILRSEYDPASHARGYAAAGAAAISVLTEPTFFDGTLGHLQAVRRAVELPLLRKDFIVSRYQLLEAIASGADAVLLIVAALADAELRHLLGAARELGLAALVEVHDEAELRRALDEGAGVIGVNSRNLRTLGVDSDVHARLAPLLPANVVAVAESGLRSQSDLSRLETAGYHAFLIGERLMTQPDPGAALRTLRGTDL